MNKKIALLCIGLITAPICASEPDDQDQDALISSYVLGYALANTVSKYYQDFRTIGRGPEWLFDALEKNNMLKMNLLLFLGVDPNIDAFLVEATYQRNPYAVKRLLQFGAVDHPNTNTKKFMALHCCFTTKYEPNILLALLTNESKNYIPEKKAALQSKAIIDLEALKNNHQISPPDDDLWPLAYGKENIPVYRKYIFSCHMFGLKP